MLSKVIIWFAENWLAFLGVILTALGTVLTVIGYCRTKFASETLNIVAALRDAFRLYEIALKARWNSHPQGRKLALTAIDEFLAQYKRYYKQFKGKGLQEEEWAELLKQVEEARIYLAKGEAQDCRQAQDRLIRCVRILYGLMGVWRASWTNFLEV